MVKRIFVQKKDGFDVEAKELLNDLIENLGLKNLRCLKILNRYDVEGISDKIFEEAKNTIFSEPQVDVCYEEEYNKKPEEVIFGVEFLPGQFDQRANSLAECLQIISGGKKLNTKSAKIYVLTGNLTDKEIEEIKKYVINSVDSRECTLEKHETLENIKEEPEDVKIVEGFIGMKDENVKEFYEKYGFAMDIDDLKFCQRYFRDEEKRDPTMTEMKMIDTYWSDHCRHTTFFTKYTTIRKRKQFSSKTTRAKSKRRAITFNKNNSN